MKDILKLSAMKSDGIERGDDLMGVVECARRYLGDVVVTLANGPHRLGTVKAGGRPMDIYGDDAALAAAKRLRFETIKTLAAAVDKADAVLGLTHPLAQYLSLLREGCGPEPYRARGESVYRHAAACGCDLRFDRED